MNETSKVPAAGFTLASRSSTDYPTMTAIPSRLLILFLAIGLHGCAGNAPDYAERYRDALQRQQGTSAVTAAMIDAFVRFFSHSGAGPAPDPAALYGEPLYFSDTLLTTDGRAAALAHLRRMHESTESLHVEILDRQVDGQDVYLVWQMRATFTPLTGAVTSSTIGVSHLRFGSDGRIILQQDFWDSAAGLYSHVPVLGGLIDAVRGRFAENASN